MFKEALKSDESLAISKKQLWWFRTLLTFTILGTVVVSLPQIKYIFTSTNPLTIVLKFVIPFQMALVLICTFWQSRMKRLPQILFVLMCLSQQVTEFVQVIFLILCVWSIHITASKRTDQTEMQEEFAARIEKTKTGGDSKFHLDKIAINFSHKIGSPDFFASRHFIIAGTILSVFYHFIFHPVTLQMINCYGHNPDPYPQTPLSYDDYASTLAVQKNSLNFNFWEFDQAAWILLLRVFMYVVIF